jgi:predicted metal-dependent hydrolase
VQVRFPRIDYSRVRPDWAPNHEFAHDRNASSTIPTYIEPYLIRIMNRAKDALPQSEAELRQAIEFFNHQEGQHTRQHSAFNRRIREFYPDILPLEMKLKEDLERFAETKSLRFNLAYCEGFESLGPPAAKIWFEDSDALLEGADYEATAMWKWHMAEEFEHREVCWRTFKTLYAKGFLGGLFVGWLYRVYGFLFVFFHLGAYTKAVRQVMVARDRSRMSADELAQSYRNAKAVARLMLRSFLPALLPVLSPLYDPGKKRPPRGMDAYLARFEKGGDMGREAPAAIGG